jgi:hypothetical protein
MSGGAPRITVDQVQSFVEWLRTNAFGRDNAKTALQVSVALELGRRASGRIVDGDRICRALANAARKSGQPVCSGNNGYWLPASPEEADETIGRLKSQGADMLAVANDLSRAVASQFNVKPKRRGISPDQMPLGL